MALDTAGCPNECHGQPIPCWSPGGPCPPSRDGCEMCGECAYCRNVADLGSRETAMPSDTAPNGGQDRIPTTAATREGTMFANPYNACTTCGVRVTDYIANANVPCGHKGYDRFVEVGSGNAVPVKGSKPPTWTEHRQLHPRGLHGRSDLDRHADALATLAGSVRCAFIEEAR